MSRTDLLATMALAVEAPPRLSRADRYRKVIESLVIRDEEGRLVPMRFSDSQALLWDHVAPTLNERRKCWQIILKARQIYASTLYCGLSFVRCMEAPNTHALVIAQDLDTSTDLFGKITLAYNNLPLPKLGKPTKRELKIPLPGGTSRYRVISAGIEAKGRGTTQTILHGSEVAHWPHPEILTGILQAMPDLWNTMLVLESTANGMRGVGQWFYDEWIRSVAGESDLKPIFIPWFVMPKYRKQPAIPDGEWDDDERLLVNLCGIDGEQLAWRRFAINTKLQGSSDRFNQEFPSCVVGHTRVSTEEGIIRIDAAETSGEAEGGGRIVKWGPQPASDLWQLTTSEGRVLEGTADHPVRLSTGAFRALSELQPGNEIRLRVPRFARSIYRVDVPGEFASVARLSVTEELARFLGYFVGDGSYGRGVLSIACDAKDADVVEDVAALFDRFFGSHHRRVVGSKGGGVEIRRGTVGAANWLKQLGLWQPEKPHRQVCVPECIFRSPRAVVRQFLRGLFEADGFFNGYCQRRVVLFSKHVEFLRDVQLLLLGFGVTSRVKSRPTVSGFGFRYVARTLELRAEETAAFGRAIGFVGRRKNGRFAVQRSGGRRPLPITLTDTVADVRQTARDITWDLTVEPDHVFSANGIETHNTPELAFIFTGDPAFDHRAIYKQREHIREPVARGTVTEARRSAWVEDPKGAVRIWEWPRDGAQYVIGADTAEGILGGDYACAEIFDMRSMEQVAAIHGYIPPWDFAKLLNDVGRIYNNAVLAIEINNTGHAVQDPLIRVYFYPNLHRWRGKPDQIKWGHSRLFGWETNTYSRPLMIDAGRRAVNTGLVTLREEKLLDELKHFSRNDFGKYEAEAGHDDRVIALLIALRSREENYFPARVNLQGVSEEVSLNSQLAVRVVDQAEPDRLGRHRFSRLLRERVKQAVEQADPRKWMTL